MAGTIGSALRFDLFVRDRTKGGIDSANKRFGALGKATLALGGAGAVIGSAINKAAQFDKTIRVAGAAADASAEQMKDMAKTALDMGSKTQFGAQGAADAMVELAKAGMGPAEQKAGALQQTLLLASAGGLELGDAATYMVNSLSLFGLKSKDAARVSTALAGGANASTASVESLGLALSQVGPGAKNAGLSLEETVGVLSAFDKAGVKGSDAGTSLKTMLTRLVPTTKAAKDAMKEMGLKFTDAQGRFKPITEIAETLRQKFKGLTEEQKTQRLATIFGSDATRAASILIDNGAKGLQKYIDATKDRKAAEKAAGAQTEGASGNMKKFKAALDTLQIVMALKLLPAVTKVTGGLTKLVNKITEKAGPAIDALKDAAKKAAGPFKNLKDKITDALSDVDFSGISKKLTEDATGWASAVITGVKDGFDKGDWSEVGKSAGKGIGDALDQSGELAIKFFGWIGEQIEKVNWVDLGVKFGKKAPLLLAGLAIGILNFDIGGLLSGLGEHWFEVILGIITVAFLPERLVGRLAALLAKVPFAGTLLAWFVRTISSVSKGIVTASGRIAVDFVAGLARGLEGVAPRVAMLLEKAILAIVHLLNGGAPKIGSAVAGWGRSMLSALGEVPGKLANLAGRMVGRFFGALVKGAAKVDTWLGGWGGRILGSIGDFGGLLVKAGEDLIGGLVKGIMGKFNSLGGAMKSLVQKVTGKLADEADMHSPSRLMAKYGRWFVEGFAVGMKDWQDKAVDQATALVDKLKIKLDAVREFAKGIRDAFRDFGNVTSIDTMLTDAGGNQLDGGLSELLRQQKAKVDQAKQFAATITKLRKMGLNADTLGALRDAGPDQGLKAAQQILGGGGSAVAEFNSLAASLNQISKSFARSEARGQFGLDPYAKATAMISGNGQTIKLVLDPSKSSDKLTRALIESLREWVRVNGRGDVQVALGAKK